MENRIFQKTTYCSCGRLPIFLRPYDTFSLLKVLHERDVNFTKKYIMQIFNVLKFLLFDLGFSIHGSFDLHNYFHIDEEVHCIIITTMHLKRFLRYEKHWSQSIIFCRYCNSRRVHNDTKKENLKEYVNEKVRNFSIIAHVDHGKSTLADRLLEYTGTIQKNAANKQVLDKLQVERERGITVKAQTSSMFYKSLDDNVCLFNLIDTPGHVDFGYEVSRSLAACQGALLVIDAAQGIQAQTVANYTNALEANLTILPVLNKIDLPSADVDGVSLQVERILGIDMEDVVQVSAKLGTGIDSVLEAVYERIPSPTFQNINDLSLFLFDSWYDIYRGVICLMAVRGGVLKKGDKLQSVHSQERYEVLDVGILHPDEVSVDMLSAGQVGYVVMGMRDVNQALIGDTFHHVGKPVDVATGFKQPQPMVFAGVYPSDQSLLLDLRKAIEKLKLNDSSVDVHTDNSAALGQGWRIGFLGLLHMDVFKQRLSQEYDTEVIMTTPSVPYQATLRKADKPLVDIKSAEEFPDPSKAEIYYEPMVLGTLIFPEMYLGKIMSLCENKRGEQVDLYIDDNRVILKYKLPLNEIVIDFYDQLKTMSSGYASFDYEQCGYQESQIEKMEICLNGKPVDALSTIVHKTKAKELGKSYCFKLKDAIPRQQFEVIIQAVIRGKVIAKDVIKPVRKDVTAKLYGGDNTRRRKLLDRQKEGKKRLKKFGNVEVPHEAFISLIKR